jgi:hypothetical protein
MVKKRGYVTIATPFSLLEGRLSLEREGMLAWPYRSPLLTERGDLTTSLPSSFLESERGHQLYALLLLMKGCVRISSFEEGYVCP